MNKQLPLFPMAGRTRPGENPPGCHWADPETSHRAAKQFKKRGKLRLHRRIVLDGVRRCNGGTHSEIAAVTPLDWLQVARRLSELERDGLVRKGGPRTCTVKKSRCCTWWIVDG